LNSGQLNSSAGQVDPGDDLQQLSTLRAWFSSSLGSQLLETECSILDQLLPGLFGYRLLQLGVIDQNLYDSSPVGHRIRMGVVGDRTPFIGNFTELPFESGSIDILLLHHVLDICEVPQHILREASRVSIPAGYLVIVGFNPLSIWGLWRLMRIWSKKPPWDGNFIRPGRLMDWLNLLDFKIDRAIFGLYKPPSAAFGRVKMPDFSRGLSRNFNWPFGAVYVIMARKQVGGMTRIRPVWRTRETRLGQISGVKPMGRDMEEH
jgi:SAM-dependent methyltransferase